jgi:hypothetical protein
MHRKMIVSVIVLSALLVMPITSNTGNVAISAGNSNPAASPGPSQPNEFETPDDRLAAVARQVPGFGGMFFDQDGILQVYMLGQKGPLSEALTAFLDDVITREVGRGERLSQKGFEIREGKYDFLDLHRWQRQMAPAVLSLPGVVFTDIDDTTNRLRIGITDLPGRVGAVEEILDTLGIPREAALINETKPVWPELQSRRRPLRGGLQINYGNFLCTLGFIAIRQGVTGIVTNSHCTNTQGGVEGTKYHQPSFSFFSQVAEEIVDPTYFTGGSCPAGRRCRFSDSSFARIGGVDTGSALGTIAAPNGSVTWNGIDIFNITAEGSVTVGQPVLKVGRTTGRTHGSITHTCVAINQANSIFTQFCQNRASYSSAGGDSGSPVFRVPTKCNARCSATDLLASVKSSRSSDGGTIWQIVPHTQLQIALKSECHPDLNRKDVRS